MTELLARTVEVRTGPGAEPLEVRLPGGGRRAVERITARWVVEADWWRAPVRREYHRLLLAGGECVDVCHEPAAGGWTVVRRYD